MNTGILHKASNGYRQGWEEIETKWLELESGLADVAKTSDRVIQEVESTAGLVAGELLLGYKWLRKLL